MSEYEIGDRVYWFEPADVLSGFGTVKEVRDHVIFVLLDEGGEIEALEHELMHDCLHTYAEPLYENTPSSPQEGQG